MHTTLGNCNIDFASASHFLIYFFLILISSFSQCYSSTITTSPIHAGSDSTLPPAAHRTVHWDLRHKLAQAAALPSLLSDRCGIERRSDKVFSGTSAKANNSPHTHIHTHTQTFKFTTGQRQANKSHCVRAVYSAQLPPRSHHRPTHCVCLEFSSIAIATVNQTHTHRHTLCVINWPADSFILLPLYPCCVDSTATPSHSHFHTQPPTVYYNVWS